MTPSADFTRLYERYRLFEAAAYYERRAAACRRRRLLLLATALTTAALAIVFYVLAGLRPSHSGFLLVAGTAMLSATFASEAALAVSNYGRQENLDRETARELTAMRQVTPEPAAGEPELSSWVWQAETILHAAQADPRPLRPPPATPPPGRRA